MIEKDKEEKKIQTFQIFYRTVCNKFAWTGVKQHTEDETMKHSHSLMSGCMIDSWLLNNEASEITVIFHFDLAVFDSLISFFMHRRYNNQEHL